VVELNLLLHLQQQPQERLQQLQQRAFRACERKEAMTQKITKETLSEAIEAEVKAAFLSEAVKEGVKFRFGSKELEFGSPEHIRVLQALLSGMESLRDCYSVGSANRHVYAAACHKLRKLIAKHAK
jgi:hypothetical protein